MIPNIGPLEIAVVLLVVIVLFGPKRLPELGSGLGRGIREFRDGISAPGERGSKDPSHVTPERNPDR